MMTSKEKAPLVERILAAGGKGTNGYTIDPATLKGSTAREGTTPIGALLPGLGDVSVEKPAKAKANEKAAEWSRGGVPESEAVVAGTLKAALQQFALVAAGGYTGRDPHVAFTTHLLECFGWKDGRPDGAEKAE